MRVLNDKMPHEVEVAFLAATIILRFFPVGLFWTKKQSDILFPLKKVYPEKIVCFSYALL